MKIVNILFWTVVAGIGVSFGMGVYTAVAAHRAEKAREAAPLTIPLPAEAPRPSR